LKSEGEHAYPLEKLSYELNGLAMRVHRELGHGFNDVVYKDALEIEFDEAGIIYEREKSFPVFYRGIRLEHRYRADFIACDKIVIEVKAQKGIADENCKQVINYLAVSKCKLGLIYNFGTPSLGVKRVIL
jgi:GxxExxY protein